MHLKHTLYSLDLGYVSPYHSPLPIDSNQGDKLILCFGHSEGNRHLEDPDQIWGVTMVDPVAGTNPNIVATQFCCESSKPELMPSVAGLKAMLQ